MMDCLQQISGDLKKVELHRLNLKWCAQSNGSAKFQNRTLPLTFVALSLATAPEP